jgi:hypothetical protein
MMAEIAFKGGDKLEAALKQIAEKAGNKVLRVGFLEGSNYPDGTPVAMIAMIQNFGAPAAGIPARPFFSNMVKEKSPDWGDDLSEALDRNDFDGEKSLGELGDKIRGQIQKAIIDTNEPPLSPQTIARKGFSKPLIDTSNMINSVNYEVKDA